MCNDLYICTYVPRDRYPLVPQSLYPGKPKLDLKCKLPICPTELSKHATAAKKASGGTTAITVVVLRVFEATCTEMR